MKPSFSEQETEAFYDREDAKYRSFWDAEGSLHWGFFSGGESGPASQRFMRGCGLWNRMMLEASGIDADSRVLDLGCGNGNTSIWLAQSTGCEVVGVDLSGVRIANAQKSLSRLESGLRVTFLKGSALQLPCGDSEFTHVWSQATFYHVPQRKRVLREAFRVLRDRGRLIFDDLTSPTPEVDSHARKFVYDRLLFQPDVSHEDYRHALDELGFFVAGEMDLSAHLKSSYALLAEMAREGHPELAEAYVEMCRDIECGQVGWSFFNAVKVSDRLAWVYEGGATPLEKKYDAWARSYEQDLAESYGGCPRLAAQVLAMFVAMDQPVLDAGCGTGLVGDALHVLGFRNLAGLDQSDPMLTEAAGKGVYRELRCHDLHSSLPAYPAESFQAVIAVGVFSFNHLEPSALAPLCAMLKPGGMLVVTARVDYLEQTPGFSEMIRQLGLVLQTKDETVIFENEKIFVFAYLKP